MSSVSAAPGRLHRLAALALALSALSGPARASDDAALALSADAEPPRVTQQVRPFAFAVDPSTPSRGIFSVGYTFGLDSGVAADRPLPVNLASASGSSTISASFGVTGQLAPFVSATLADAGSTTATQSWAAGLTWQVTNPASHLRLAVSAAGMREGTGDAGATALITGSMEGGRMRLVANIRADKVFAAGRDGVDTLVVLGGSWRLAEWARLGAEYVGQDLEETFNAGAEGGARHSLGPTLALDLDGGRYQLALGTGIGLTARSPRAIARAVLAYSF